jgi:maltokinase
MTDTLDNRTIEQQLLEWLPQQRWFSGKSFHLESVRVVMRQPVSREPDPSIDHIIVEAGFADRDPQMYQVPLGFRRQLPHELAQFALAPGANGVTAYDAMRDPEAIDVYTSMLAARKPIGAVRLRFADPGEAPFTGHGRALSAEQSNTSVVLGEALLFKLFRLVNPGVNPDVELLEALGRGGSEHIAKLRAWIEMSAEDIPGLQADPAASDGDANATLAMIQDYERNAADGWAMALGSVRDLLMEADLHAGEVGTDFAAESRRLGAAVASVHQTLVDVLGEKRVAASLIVEGMIRRLDLALEAAPELIELAPAIRSRYAAAEEMKTLVVQRIHGDLHLGQVLRTPESWLLIDFEGEPAKPIAMRRAPDSPLRDVAGMIRSFDYAAHFPVGEVASEAERGQRMFRAREWASRNASAFCDGYAEEAGEDPRSAGALLEAYELDKAIYEVLYEKRNRPKWVALPLDAIGRIVSGSQSAPPPTPGAPEPGTPGAAPGSPEPREPTLDDVASFNTSGHAAPAPKPTAGRHRLEPEDDEADAPRDKPAP